MACIWIMFCIAMQIYHATWDDDVLNKVQL